MDIEERAEKYARDHTPINVTTIGELIEIVRDAYLAGSAQTQRDYTAHYQ